MTRINTWPSHWPEADGYDHIRHVLTTITTSCMSWPLTIATKPVLQPLIIAKAATQNWSINVTIKQYAVVLIHVFSMGKGSTKMWKSPPPPSPKKSLVFFPDQNKILTCLLAILSHFFPCFGKKQTFHICTCFSLNRLEFVKHKMNVKYELNSHFDNTTVDCECDSCGNWCQLWKPSKQGA